MKKLILLSIFTLTLSFSFTTTFAQRDSGGSSDGTSIPPDQSITYNVPVGGDLVLTFTQTNANSLPVLAAVTRNGVVTTINGNLSNLGCLNFFQFFQVLISCSNECHPSGYYGCHQSSCHNPRCH